MLKIKVPLGLKEDLLGFACKEVYRTKALHICFMT